MTIRKQTAMWITKDKSKIRICDMGNEHLINTIKMLRRTACMRLEKEINAAYRVLSTLQGEIAIDCCENDIEVLEHTDPEDFLFETLPVYEKLLLEAKRRGIKVGGL